MYYIYYIYPRSLTLAEIMYNISEKFDFQLISVISNLRKSQKSINFVGIHIHDMNYKSLRSITRF